MYKVFGVMEGPDFQTKTLIAKTDDKTLAIQAALDHSKTGWDSVELVDESE